MEAVLMRPKAADSVRVARVSVAELSVTTIGQVRRDLEALIEVSRNVLVDLSAVRSIDAAGVGVLLRAAKLSRSQGGKLAIAGAQPPVAKMLEAMQVHRAMPVLVTAPEATPKHERVSVYAVAAVSR